MTADTPIADNDPCPDIPAAVYHARRAAHMEALREFYGALRGRRLSCQQRRCGARTVHAKRPVVSDRGEYFASIRQAREATGASGKGIRASLDDPERRRSAGRRWYPADSPEGRRLIAQAEARRADAGGRAAPRTKHVVRPVRTAEGHWFGSIKEAAAAFGVTPSAICSALSGRQKRAANQRWFYADEQRTEAAA